jgi:hypothetical protein
MATYSPSPSFNDPGWIPGYWNLTPEERNSILDKSIRIESHLKRKLQDTQIEELELGEGNIGALEWTLMFLREDDGNVRLVFSYMTDKDPYWRSIRASPVVFVRSFMSGQWEGFKRFEVDAGFDAWTLASPVMRPVLGGVFSRLIRRTMDPTAIWLA